MAKHFVATLAEWLDLPELFVPTCKGSDGKGIVYKILKVGFVPVSPAECRKANLRVKSDQAGKCFLTTVLIEEQDGSQKLHRLPLSLEDWATNLVEMVAVGMDNPFPRNVRFGLRQDRIFAELL
jgi:hypothetical protein